MFKTLTDMAEQIEIYLDGKPVQVPAGISVAAAMLLLGALPTRQTALSGSPRAPFCMMGTCFECLLEIDGRLNQRACQFEVEAGMRVSRQCVAGEPDS